MGAVGRELRISALAVVLLVVIFALWIDSSDAKKMFQYPRYHYKKKPRSETLFNRDFRHCEVTEECSQLSGRDRTNCVRFCISPECYNELYSWDELEEGEIDVRVQSFKGCWMKQVLNVKYNKHVLQ